MRRRSLVLGVLALLALTAAAQAEPESVQVTPKHGGLRTDFLVHFQAPQATGASHGMYAGYSVSAQGPGGRGCASSAVGPVPMASQGEDVSVTLKPLGRFHSWCRGAYAGTVVEMIRPQCGYRELCPEIIGVVILGRFEFRVS